MTRRFAGSFLVCGSRARVLRNLQSHFGALDRIKSRLVVEIGCTSLQSSFGAGLGFFCALYVDVLCALGGLREDGHFLGQDLGKSPGNGEVLGGAFLLVGDFADGQLGNERRVARQNADVAGLPWNFHAFDRLVHQQVVGRHNLEFDLVSHELILEMLRSPILIPNTLWHDSCYAVAFIFSPASTTSSMPPLRKNACSGTSSYLPSRISWKPRTVSSTLTYLPLTPVNCSATWNGCEKKRWILRARATVSFWSSLSSSIPRMAMISCRSL